MEHLFYYLGGGLTVVAVILSATGMRSHGFPSSKAQFAGILTAMAALVLATGAFAVVLSKDEQDKRADEAAAEAANEPVGAEGAAGAAGQEAQQAVDAAQGQGSESAPAGGGGAGTTLKLSSPPSGDLVYDAQKLSAKAGPVTIDYTDPSPVPHSVAIEDSSGAQLAEGDTVADGGVSEASAEDLAAGEYAFYCTVPGHREAGMEGTLTVK